MLQEDGEKNETFYPELFQFEAHGKKQAIRCFGVE